MKHTIYHCLSKDNKTIPPTLLLVHEADTQQKAVDWLENNGGGIYRNILHNFQYEVKSNG